MCEQSEISPLDLPPKFMGAPSEKTEAPTPIIASEITSIENFYEAVEAFEKNYLAARYKMMEGNISRMAVELGMDRSYLHGKLKNYGVHQSKK